MALWKPWYAALSLALLAAGCGTHEQATDDRIFSPPPAEQQPPPMSIETKTDTIATIHTPGNEAQPERAVLPQRFKVQIGAFHDPQRATAIQNLARERFALPASNEYDTGAGTYRIRIGSFETHKEAEDFRRKMQQEFPGEYGDAWIIIPGVESR